MIYTNEPANVLYVLVSAARANLPDVSNMKRQLALKSILQFDPEYYGVLECTGLTGWYREEGQELATQERTYRVRCENKAQALNVARLACNTFDQDCVLVYKSQTHTAGLMFCKGLDGYRVNRLNGSFQQVAADRPASTTTTTTTVTKYTVNTETFDTKEEALAYCAREMGGIAYRWIEAASSFEHKPASSTVTKYKVNTETFDTKEEARAYCVRAMGGITLSTTTTTTTKIIV